MRTTSMRTEIAVFFVLAAGACQAATPTLELEFSGNDMLEIHHTPKGVRASLVQPDGKKLPVMLDARANSLLAAADEAYTIPQTAVLSEGAQAAIAIVRIPSNRKNPSGYCGAGHEDYLAFFTVAGKKLVLNDSKLIQSCLKSISLVSDSGNDPKNAISFDRHSSSIHFQSSSPPAFDSRDHSYRIKDGLLFEQAQGKD